MKKKTLKKISPKVMNAASLGLPELETSEQASTWGSFKETFKGIFMLFTMPV